MTVPSPLTPSGAFPMGLRGLYQCRPGNRGKRENNGGQNLSVVFGWILNKKEQRVKGPGPMHTFHHTVPLWRWLSRGFH